MSSEKYLTMQKDYYNVEASHWSLENKNPVVGWYHEHTVFADYDNYLFKDFDTTGKVALEYGCGPGRNLIRYASRFDRVDGVDISPINIEKAKINLVDALKPQPAWETGLTELKSKLYTNNGSDIPVDTASYDVVFSVICLQHICVHEIRYKIMEEIYRVLKPGGYFCAQMGFGGREGSVGYYENNYDAISTNGQCDVSIENEKYLKKDLSKIGFKDYKSDLRTPCCDLHKQWIWFQLQK
jgi:SAM-dependent methyltransferase